MSLAKLNRNTRFVTIRSETGAIAVDGTIPPTTVVDADRFDPDGSDEVVFYWDAGTSPAGTLDFELYVLDVATSDKWVKAAGTTGVAPAELATLKCKGASQCHLVVSGASGSNGSDLTVRAYAWHPGA